jgi:hypothetical protein
MVRRVGLLGVFGFTLCAWAAQDADLDARIEALIRAFKDDSKEARDKAVNDLVAIGKPALSALEKAAQEKDPEVKGLAQQAVERIGWGKADELMRKYVRDQFETGATVEPLKLKTIQKWFPTMRFFEVNAPAPPGNNQAMMMGMGAPRTILAMRRDDPAFYRVSLRGVFSSSALSELVRRENIKMKEHDDAFDFATSFMELYINSVSGGRMSYGGGTAPRFEKSKDGWEIQSPNMGTQLQFKLDSEGMLTDIGFSQGYNNYNPSYQKVMEEKSRLEVEKLKVELELLKGQLEQLKKK